MQNFITEKATKIISEQLNTEVSIEHVSYQAPFDIVLIDLLVEDYEKDTLFYVNYLKFRPIHYSYKKNSITIDKVKVKGFRTEYRIDSTGYSNYDFFLDNLPDSGSDTSQSSYSVFINKISVDKSSIFYTTQELDTIPYEFDLDTFDIQNLNLKIKKFSMVGDSIHFFLDKFSFQESSGFKVRSFSTNFLMTDNQIAINDFRLRLNKSRFIIDQATFNYVSLDDLANNQDNLFFEVFIREQSEFNFLDLGYFSPLFENYQEKIKFGLIASGNIGHLVSERFTIKYKSATYFLSNFELFGLPNVDNLFFDFQFQDFRTDLRELLALKNPLDNNKPFFELPQDYNVPRDIYFTGGITGKIDDFVFLGDAETSVGNFNANLEVILDSLETTVIGGFELIGLDVGYILKNEMVGNVSLVDSINLTMIDSNTFLGFNNTKISQAELNDYNYINLVSELDFNYDSIVAFLSIDDPNFVMNFNCAVKLAGIDTKTKFALNVDTVRLFPLHFIEDDELAALSVAFEGEFTGNNIDDLEGDFYLTQPLLMIKNLQKLELNVFTLKASNKKKVGDNTLRKIEINSELLSGYIEGTFDFEDLGIFAENVDSYYFPALGNDSIIDIFKSEKSVGNNLQFNLTLKNIEPITSIFAPDVYIARNSNIVGYLHSFEEEFNISFVSDSVVLSGNKLKQIEINVDGNQKEIVADFSCDSIGLSGFKFEKFNVELTGLNDSAGLKVSWKNKSDKKNEGVIRTNLFMSKDNSEGLIMKFIVPQDTFYVNNKQWTVYSDSIFVDSTGIQINGLTASSFLKEGSSIKQYIGIMGKASDKDDDTLVISLQKFDLSQLNPILKDVKVEGYMKSDFAATSLLDTPKIVLTNHIDRFAINDVALGEVEQTVKWVDKDKLLHNELSVQKVDSKLENRNGKDTLIVSIYRSLYIVGDYYLETESFDFELTIDNLKFKPFAPYLDDYIRFSRNSNLNGKLRIKGDKLFYNVGGEINVYGAFMLPATGVNYTINGGLTVRLLKDKIVIDSTVIAGPSLVGDALLYGNVKHKDFHDPYVQLFFRADTIAFVDLPRTNKSEYYGKIIASGNIDISGYPEDLSVKADIITEKNTDFTLLLDRPGEISNKTSIVTFVTPQDTVFTEEVKEDNTSNIDIDLNLTLNPEAKFKIVFNELTDEALEIQGEGNVKIKKTALGELVVFGKISITKGVYNFVLENIKKWKFDIVKGSSIVFNGDPMDGILDISTVNSIKNVSLYNLMMSQEYENQKTQADCYINLKGPILNPSIRFSVKLPKADQRIAAQVDNLDDANMNKQFLSLLIFGRFQPLPGLTFNPDANIAAGAFNAGDLISNQLNSLLSNINTDVDLDVNYVTGNQQTTDQFDVAMSIPLLNERVSIVSDVGVGGNTAGGTQNNFIGDFEVDVKLNKKGNVIFKAFNKTNRNEFYDKGPYTQGLGILYKTDFDNIFKKDTSKNVISDTLKRERKN
ncbi:MAG: translocation/assembly module TamB domain-containing protein [Bacteroidales bacterium]|nr:translocation/assembly module TamB domain-containing protein [Bacteroidales bacterium]